MQSPEHLRVLIFPSLLDTAMAAMAMVMDMADMEDMADTVDMADTETVLVVACPC